MYTNENYCNLSGMCFNSMFTDIDECAVEGYCDNGATCTNLEGGYNCDCVEGWTGVRCYEGLKKL